MSVSTIQEAPDTKDSETSQSSRSSFALIRELEGEESL